ncbi:hypothetical protein [Umezawaea beigongshangensis]|uniref:hypothetical protein n=1 Tax=Umezawaea beigongshangensis TaxID=2780383 RepID=UPI0018F1F292|nr:hypothetical protein [Umezawaea beigongshangensis]
MRPRPCADRHPDAEAVREAAQTLLGDTGVAENARRLARAHDALAEVERLVLGRESRAAAPVADRCRSRRAIARWDAPKVDRPVRIPHSADRRATGRGEPGVLNG